MGDKESLRETIELLQDKVQELRESVARRDEMIRGKDEEIRLLEDQLEEKHAALQGLSQQLRTVYNSRTWRIGQAVGNRLYGTKAARVLERIVDGLLGEGRKGLSIGRRDEKRYRNRLREIMESNRDAKGIIVYPPTVDWNIPLYQRPHHMAVQMARRGYLFFYCSGKSGYDDISGFREIEKSCYLTDQYDLIINTMKGFVFDVYSTSSIPVETIERLSRDNVVVYEYIDHIHVDISGTVSHLQRLRHNAIKPHIILASATNLFEEMRARFGEVKTHYLPNAVDYEHFHRARDADKVPADMRDIVLKGRPIIGYYGALATWIDYGLLNRLAAARRDLEIVLIGWDYDGSIGRLDGGPNVHYLGTKPYAEIPGYGIWFDVAIIPFSEGDIANSTSPLKLFEYMALGKPVVTTNMEECKRYRSVLSSASGGEFIAMIQRALDLRDDREYRGMLDREARENTWQARAEEFDNLIQRAAGPKIAELSRSETGLPR